MTVRLQRFVKIVFSADNYFDLRRLRRRRWRLRRRGRLFAINSFALNVSCATSHSCRKNRPQQIALAPTQEFQCIHKVRDAFVTVDLDVFNMIPFHRASLFAQHDYACFPSKESSDGAT